MVIRAVIFDLDGTLANTETLHLAAFSKVLGIEGVHVSEEDYFTRLIGYTDRDCFEILLRENGMPAKFGAIERLMARKAQAYRELIAGQDLLYPGAAEFTRRCAKRFPLILATGTLREEAEFILAHAGLRDLFLDIVAAEDVERGKPAPDCYLAAQARLRAILKPNAPVAGRQCLAVEDTAAGIEAARGAGMKVLAIAHTTNPENLAAAGLVMRSLKDADLDYVLARLGG